jgi:glycyl-tRNA synthetase beta chain
VVDEVFDFAMERLRAYYIEGGSSAQTFEAVRSRRPSWPRDFDRRLRAVADFARLPEADSLAAANKRILNILRRAEDTIPETVKADLLRAPEEQALHTALTSLTAEVEPLVTAGDYQPALSALARLKEPVDKFFDAVMVMDEETALRVNRLALLRRVSQLFLRVADVSRLQVG